MPRMLTSTWVNSLKKIIVHEIFDIQQWDSTKDIAPILGDVESKLNLHLKRTIDVNPSLMMPDNYARILLDP